jgi:hypothetical protein
MGGFLVMTEGYCLSDQSQCESQLQGLYGYMWQRPGQGIGELNWGGANRPLEWAAVIAECF